MLLGNFFRQTKCAYLISLSLLFSGCVAHRNLVTAPSSSSPAINIVLLGAPGSGKGTLATSLKEDFKLCHISTGEIVRREIKDKTDFGKMAANATQSGNLLTDGQPGMAHLIKLVKERMLSPDCVHGFILDGFPRTLWQAEELDSVLNAINNGVHVAVLLDVNEQTVLNRLEGRLNCTNKACGQTFNEKQRLPKKPNQCDACGASLEKRVDDQKSDAIHNRFSAYLKNSDSINKYYSATGKLLRINGEKEAGQVYSEVLEGIEQLKFPRDYIKKNIKSTYDETKKVNYINLTEMYKDVALNQFITRSLASKIALLKPDYIAAPEARALPTFGSLIDRLKIPGIFIRKIGKLPSSIHPLQQYYNTAYSRDGIEMTNDPMLEGKSVAIIDDGIASGGTTLATIKLLEQANMKVVGIFATVQHSYARNKNNHELTNWIKKNNVKIITLFDN